MALLDADFITILEKGGFGLKSKISRDNRAIWGERFSFPRRATSTIQRIIFPLLYVNKNNIAGKFHYILNKLNPYYESNNSSISIPAYFNWPRPRIWTLNGCTVVLCPKEL
jgi:hypothetical protein